MLYLPKLESHIERKQNRKSYFTPYSGAMAHLARLPRRSGVPSLANFSHVCSTLPRSYLRLTKINTYATVQASSPAPPENKFLRQVLSDIPYVKEKTSPPEPSEFEFPLATLFKVPNRDVGLDMTKAYSRALQEHGICGIELNWPDPNSDFILDVVHKIGGKPDTHSKTQGALWDVKWKPEGVYSEGTGTTANAISHSMGEFAWHTDGAFEEQPTRFFGFHILHPDKRGGGVFRILRADDLVQLLSARAVKCLTTHEYDLRVPPEFFKGKKTVKGKLLEIDPKTGQAYVRYRKDILHHPASRDRDACAAVAELMDLLGMPDDVGEYVPEFAFKENTILLMDNARYLHSRTNIKDPDRWLRRVRFHGDLASAQLSEPSSASTSTSP